MTDHLQPELRIVRMSRVLGILVAMTMALLVSFGLRDTAEEIIEKASQEVATKIIRNGGD